MVVKAIIESYNQSSKEVKVRVPSINKSSGAGGATPYDELSYATLCVPPKFEYTMCPGDIVFVSFENNDTGKPVILGMLSLSSVNSTCSAEFDKLTVSEKIVTNNISIGDVDESSLEHLSGVCGNIQGGIDSINKNCNDIAKALGIDVALIEDLYKVGTPQGLNLINRILKLKNEKSSIMGNVEKLSKTIANTFSTMSGSTTTYDTNKIEGISSVSSVVDSINQMNLAAINNVLDSASTKKIDTVIGRAEIMTFWEWSPQTDLLSWSSTGNHRTFSAGRKYVGMPYCQRKQSLETLMKKVGTGGNANSGSGFGPYYGMCCADFICLAWGAVTSTGKPRTSWAPAIRAGGSFTSEEVTNYWDDDRKNYSHELRPGDCLTNFMSHGRGRHASHVELVTQVSMDRMVYSTSEPGVIASCYNKGDLLFSNGKLFEAKAAISSPTLLGLYSSMAYPMSSNDYWSEVPEDSYPTVTITIMHQGGPLAQAYTRTVKVGTPIKKISKMGSFPSIVRLTNKFITDNNTIMGVYTGRLS